MLAVPGAVAMLLLAQLRRRSPGITDPDPDDAGAAGPPPSPTTGRNPLQTIRATVGSDLPLGFHLFSLSCALTTAGLMTFGIISFSLVGKAS